MRTMSYLIRPHLTTSYPVAPRAYVVAYCHPTLDSTPSYRSLPQILLRFYPVRPLAYPIIHPSMSYTGLFPSIQRSSTSSPTTQPTYLCHPTSHPTLSCLILPHLTTSNQLQKDVTEGVYRNQLQEGANQLLKECNQLQEGANQ